ncbi:unnamed protein product [Rhizoctonia solani]|uniref:Major facilitator superfamily (MFS) profile domain-containing protein n=1 Tax=Rhizoctonia solani TaxID=456999 RepID=A0A8H3I157_9AGAM|nr:unnamed protein product [Rhizoctonia solani]
MSPSILQNGWHDGSIGLLIPTVQAHYNLTFTVVSVLFVSECLGYMLSAILNVHLSDLLGFGRVIFLGGVFKVISYAMLVPALPFPIMAVGALVSLLRSQNVSLSRLACFDNSPVLRYRIAGCTVEWVRERVPKQSFS